MKYFSEKSRPSYFLTHLDHSEHWTKNSQLTWAILSFPELNRLSSLYFQFSLNYQRLSFPLRFQRTQFTDFGTPILLQFRTASLLSLRGSIKQTESGKSRDAELDFR